MRILQLFLVFFSTQLLSQSSPYIHVDQFGYYENAIKVAVISDPQLGYNAALSFTPSATLQVRDANTDAVVFSAAPVVWNNGNTHNQSGDRGWWFDFSALSNSGSYYIFDVGNNESSAIFNINNNVYTDVLKAAGRAFFYNRCHQAKAAPYAEANWTDAISFTQDASCRYINDPTNISLEKDLTGGWFDAGDYNKYVTFTGPTLHDLLWAYQESSSSFSDAWNIPESGNGIPDIIDEIKWELDWLIKMVNNDGSTIIKMGSANYQENVSAPPSVNVNTRYYGPTCTSAAISAAAALAHASKVFGTFPSLVTYAQTLNNKAIDCWNYALPFINNNTLEENCDDGSIVAGDADRNADEQKEEALSAAIYLFDLTNENSYNQYIINHINDASPMASGDWNNYENLIQDALLLYTTLPNADATISSNITSSISLAVSNNWNDYFGFSDSDLYRAYMPDWTYHWGSNKPKSDFGILNKLIVRYGINPSGDEDYNKKASEQLHYFHGINPLGLVYLSNMYSLGAEHGIDEIYHTWFQDGTDWDNAQTSTYGPAPGFLPGGANATYTANTSLSPPYGQPAQKSYLDWNTVQDASWEVTEPAIYTQASYLRLLAAIQANITLPVEWLDNPIAQLINGNVHIKWFTSSEWLNEKFEIEHSLDAKHFSSLASVAGKNNSTSTNDYLYIHKQAPKGINYYRIKQIDYDGHFQYSQVISIQVKKRKPLQLYPNPSHEKIVVSGEMSSYYISIYDSRGKRIDTFNFTGNTFNYDLLGMEKGLYFLQAYDIRSNQIENLQFMIF